jgi:NADH-quinone oxidoreductase subunit M
MNFSIFGFFSNDFVGLIGASFLMFTHAFISSALFLLIGILYKRYHSRFLPYYQGISITMPIYSFFFLFFSFANISLPFCASFLAEFFILVSSLHSNIFISVLLVFSLIVSSAFMIWFANRLLFGFFSPYLLYSNHFVGFKDLTFTEFLTLLPFFIFTFSFTFFPQSLISIFTLPVLYFI